MAGRGAFCAGGGWRSHHPYRYGGGRRLLRRKAAQPGAGSDRYGDRNRRRVGAALWLGYRAELGLAGYLLHQPADCICFDDCDLVVCSRRDVPGRGGRCGGWGAIRGGRGRSKLPCPYWGRESWQGARSYRLVGRTAAWSLVDLPEPGVIARSDHIYDRYNRHGEQPGSNREQSCPYWYRSIVAGIFIVLEVMIERRNLPLIELSLFKRATFSASSLVSLLVGAALIIAMVDIPLFVATVLGGGPIDSGLALLRLTVMIPIGAIIGGWLCGRITCRLTAIVGLIPAALGFWLMHLWPANVGWLQITTSTVICGLGFGLVIAPISTTAINAANKRQMGMASSTVTVLRMVGMILGLAALTSWGLGKFHDLLVAFRPPPGTTVLSPAYTTAYLKYVTFAAHEVFTSIFLAAGIVCLIAIVPAFLMEGRKSSPYELIRRG